MARATEGAGGHRHASPGYIAVTATTAATRRSVLKHANSFAVLDDCGNAQADGETAEGLFFEDTRYLSQLVLTIDGVRPLLLSSAVAGDAQTLSVDMTNPDMTTPGGEHLRTGLVHIRADYTLGENALFAAFTLQNFALTPIRFRLGLDVAADFADIFEVRGTTRARRGVVLPAESSGDDRLILAYRGLDDIVRRMHLEFDPPATAIDQPGHAAWDVDLPHDATRAYKLTAICERGKSGDNAAAREPRATARQRGERRRHATEIRSSNEAFNEWLGRSRADLDMLITQTPQGAYAYAGVPWFSTTFGRDGLVTALQCLWLDPSLAAGTLRFLAANQATRHDPAADAEPGKILHEMRHGEMAGLGEVPFGRYYGSVDSTPLFVMLAGAYYTRTGDRDLIAQIWPNIEAALGWMTDHGDLDHDDLLEYDRRSPNGLSNQGWKDSDDSIFYADGRIVEPPVALAEVQAYAYAAYLGAADLAAMLGDRARADALTERAERLRQRFEAAFWLDDLGTYALALDGAKQPCRVRSSNAGHVLLGGLAAPDRAARVAETLMAPASFTGWGIRTIAAGEARFNPLSYHNGSIWPHDNALIAMGLGRYGLKAPLLRVMSGMFDAALSIELWRLPELFCGFERRSGAAPTAYPVACSPQAWASASLFGMLGAALGISFAPEQRQIRFVRPSLPDWLDTLELTNLRLGEASADLRLHRAAGDVALTVTRRHGPVEIVVTM